MIIILKSNNNLESWVTIITFLLEFHAETNQRRFPKFCLFLGARIYERHANMQEALGVRITLLYKTKT